MLVSKRPKTLVFPVEDLGALPDKGFGALGPSENTPKFPLLRGAGNLPFPQRARKISPTVQKIKGSNPGFEPLFFAPLDMRSEPLQSNSQNFIAPLRGAGDLPSVIRPGTIPRV